jgi:hypothetical protein
MAKYVEITKVVKALGVDQRIANASGRPYNMLVIEFENGETSELLLTNETATVMRLSLQISEIAPTPPPAVQ